MNLPLLQLGDSALPIGGYCHSWGLEAAIDHGLVLKPLDLEFWVRHWLRFGVAPLEGVVVAAVCRLAARADWGAVAHANGLLQASLTVPTLRQASRDMGEQLLALAGDWPWAREVIAALWQTHSLPPHPQPLAPAGRGEQPLWSWHHATVFGTLCAAARVSPVEAIAVYLHQSALGVISAGVRAVPIGHTHGQQILARLHGDIENLALEVAEQELETAGSFCPAYEVLCHAQTRLYSRLFRS
jgi:urease accessory protein